MSRGLNKVMLIGNLGADPEIKYSANGTAIANFRLATAERRKNKDGEWEDTTEWHRVVMLGRQAEICKDFLRKGKKIYVEGRLQTRSWEDQNGQRRYMTEILGNQMVMLDPKQSTPMDTHETGGMEASSDDTMPDTISESSPDIEDDLPF